MGAAYHHDPEQVITVLKTVAAAHPLVLCKPPPEAFVTDFAESAVLYRVVFWVADPLVAFTVGSDLRREIWARFARDNITIPFPQRQIYPMEWPPADGQALQLTGGRGVMPQGEQPETTGSDEEARGQS